MPPDSILSRFGELINSQIVPQIFMSTAKGVGEKVVDANIANWDFFNTFFVKKPLCLWCLCKSGKFEL